MSERDLLQFRTARLNEGGASRTVHLDVKMWRAAWKWGRIYNFCPDRDAPTVSVNIEDVRSKPIPPVEAVYQVIHELTHRKVAWPYLATMIGLHTGARTGEIARLTWEDIDFMEGKIRFITRKSKANKERCRLVSQEVMDAIEAFGTPGNASDGIFGVTPKMITAHWSQKYLKPACEAAGVPPFTPYALRRLSLQARRPEWHQHGSFGQASREFGCGYRGPLPTVQR